MKKFKALVCLFLSLVLSLGISICFCSCGNDETADETADETQTELPVYDEWSISGSGEVATLYFSIQVSVLSQDTMLLYNTYRYGYTVYDAITPRRSTDVLHSSTYQLKSVCKVTVSPKSSQYQFRDTIITYQPNTLDFAGTKAEIHLDLNGYGEGTFTIFNDTKSIGYENSSTPQSVYKEYKFEIFWCKISGTVIQVENNEK